MFLLFMIGLFLLYTKNTYSISSNRNVHYRHLGLVIRNKMLKMLLALDYRKMKDHFIVIKEKGKEVYNLCFLKYCVYSCEYQNLKDDEKLIIETVTSLCF